jgi:lysylphosphatidylglycerol synthetase-like protein (DUF2156 family)
VFSQAGPNAGSVYSKVLLDEVSKESTRQQAIEQKGLAVITTSGVLVTLMFGLGALATNAKGFTLPVAAVPALIAAVLLFLAASVLAILTNWPGGYQALDQRSLLGMTGPVSWSGPADVASRRVAQAHAQIVLAARVTNTLKAVLLAAAISCEVMAVVVLAVAILIALSVPQQQSVPTPSATPSAWWLNSQARLA